MIQGKRIAWDIDDVCADNATGFAEFCNKTWGLAMTADDFSEDWCAMWGVDIDEVNRRSEIFHTSDAALNYAPHEGAYDTLLALSKNNENHVVTSRRALLREHTDLWIAKHFPDIFTAIHYSGIFDNLKYGDHLKTKADVLVDIKADYLVDDQLKHCIAAVEHGIPAVLFGDYKWNQTDKLPAGITRCANWKEVEEYFDVTR